MKEYVLIYATPFKYKISSEVLVVLKDRPAYQAGRFNLLGGKVEDGEHPATAAVRELYEESGLKSIGKPELLGDIKAENESVYCFHMVVDNYPILKPREVETEKVAWLPWRHLVKDSRLMPSLRIIIPLMMLKAKDWTLIADKDYLGLEFAEFRLQVPSDKMYSNDLSINQSLGIM